MSFKENYTQKVLPEIAKELDIKNPMQLPMIEKVVVNMGIGSYVASGHKDFSSLKNDLALITGQLPRVNHARKSVSNFKLREGMPVGMMVTLRGQRMYDFLEKLIAVVLPRVRDFRGISAKSFDKDGNFNFGIKEHTIFPEVPQLDVVKTHGMQITIKFKTQSKEHSHALLKKLGFPFSR
ncbi:50S ribosomal protein L5 [Candidatus Gracilibacteria bacterium GN02-873]|jgi:50S ribosomal protein L5|nr:50S ribosomal protein L5 [Candidatus Gracilibacteria bacterium]MDO4873924.1 50S ribosomal protein L5 [Candidatus Gracilibacteria bacterium]RAL55413.1 50S ribosomal protein L5 [Candidatus Gracilibacteria bacterium GN02-873]